MTDAPSCAECLGPMTPIGSFWRCAPCEERKRKNKVNVEETEWVRIKFGFTAYGQPTLRGPESASPKDRELLKRWLETVNDVGDVGDALTWL